MLCKKKNSSDTTEKKDVKQNDENTVRGNWSNKLDFLLSLIGYTVGFGNVWRFPYLCYRNGGGVFLIPYFLTLVVCGIPLYFLEVAIGQYSSLGPVGVWKMVPIFKGLGIAAVGVTGIINIYYTTLLTYVLYYLFASMTSELPWASCGHEWNTAACRVNVADQIGINSSFAYNETGILNQTLLITSNDNATINSSFSLRPATPAEEYFQRHVLELSPGIEHLGSFRWQLVLCNILGWTIGYLCLMKGVKSAGKVVYVTATFPYLVLLILLIRGLTLPGSIDGLKYYLVPNWHKLLEGKVWGDAASQIFFSLGPAWGCLIAFSSYNKFHNNCHRDSIIVCLVGCGTSVFAGSVIFAIIGFLAHDLNVGVDKVMTSGPGLAFVAYPAALARMPAAPFWAVLFFLMLITTGLDSMFAQVEVVVVTLTDQFPNTLRPRKTLFTLAVCVAYFLIGLPQMTQGGIYILTLLDWYVALFSVFVIAFLECVCIMYIYGYHNLAKDIEVMIGFKPNLYLRICWSFIAPVIVVAVLIFNSAIHTSAVYNDYKYPAWADNIGWCIAVIPILAIPTYAIYYIVLHFGTVESFVQAMRWPWTGDSLRAMIKPDPDYGPMMPQHRLEAGLELTPAQQQDIRAKETLCSYTVDMNKLPEVKIPV